MDTDNPIIVSNTVRVDRAHGEFKISVFQNGSIIASFHHDGGAQFMLHAFEADATSIGMMLIRSVREADAVRAKETP